VVAGFERVQYPKELRETDEPIQVKRNEKVELPEQTSATGSEKPVPRWMETLITNFEGMQHQLQTLTQGIKQIIREKRRAQKAHARRERRRAERQKEVEDQPQIPADSTPTLKSEGEDGIKVEAGPQPPTEDWAPPEIETEQPCKTAVRDPEGDFEESRTQKKPVEDVFIQRRDAKRMLRATKKIAHDLLRSTRDQARSAKKPKPEKKNMKIYVTMNDRVGLPFLKHWNEERRELHVGIEKGPWEIRKYLIRVYRLKRLRWVLFRRDLQGRWTELPKLLKIAKEGDEFQLEVTGRKRGRPNAPGTSRRQHFERANSRKTKRDFFWNAPDPYVNTSTQVRLNAADKIGYREEDPEIQKNIRERSAKELLLERQELLKADDRIKPKVVLTMQESACGSPVKG
jgi:hypothetical protein